MKERDAELENKIVELRKQGMKVWEIARNLGLTKNQVKGALRKRDVVVQPKQLVKRIGWTVAKVDVADEVKRLSRMGFDVHEIAYRIGNISSDAVARELGI
jgi:orotate phosphoribosyltransferase-like protein